MKTKPRFMIGDWVRVTAYAKFDYDHDQRVVSKTNLENPNIGQIVGARRKFMGQYKSGGYDDPPYLAVSGSMVVWLFRDGYLNEPYEVLEEDIEPWYDAHAQCVRFKNARDPQLPWRKTNLNWTESEKEAYRKEVKTWPRDSKGRWVK